MNKDALFDCLGDSWARSQELMHSTLRSDVSLLQKLNEDVLENGGKQLRPMLVLLMASACGKVNSDSEKFAAASEILHNATLIHDDIADESSLRRGKPTMYSVLGAGSAVLMGDFWLARSMQLIIQAERASKVSDLFSTTLTDLAEGEMLQLEKSSSLDMQEEDYYRVIYCKTASLFVAAIVSGAISVDAAPEYIEAARTYASALGSAFQIKDDILDYVGSDKLGKPSGLDIMEKKVTLPLLGALNNSSDSSSIRELIRTATPSVEICEIVRKFVNDHKGIEYASAKLDGFIHTAVDALAILPDSKAKEFLIEIAEYNAFRQQ